MDELRPGRRSVLLMLLLAVGLVRAESATETYSAHHPRIAIVIDDLGHNVTLGRKAINLPVPVTLAFLPQRNFTRALAKYGHSKGQEIILHLPMENQRDFPLGKLGLNREMPRDQWLGVLNQALESVPFAVGVNNHLGSSLTLDRSSMDWLMGHLAERGLYFLDSITVKGSVGWESAEAQRLAWTKRNVFLDTSLEPAQLDYQFQRAIGIAKREGSAVVIVHPHYQSLKFLEMRLPLARDYELVEFVPVSKILNHPERLLSQR